ncbi:MAG: hypothetical protein JWQ38_2430 [Flavipsychrobacter sp.]|nr:hypothetical protein [Flavipsychrobacter sp.]
MKSITLLLFALVANYFSYSQIITTYAGNGSWGYSGDGAAATAAALGQPFHIAADLSGNIYIADYYNHVIRKVDTFGIITTVAGNGINGFSGDGGPATAARLNYPYAITLDASGNLYISDQNNMRVRKVNSAGIISTFAGCAYSGYAGDGGPATDAQFSYPCGITIDGLGNLYLVDYSLIRKIDASGIVSTVAGITTFGYGGDGGPATIAAMSPRDVAVDGSGNLYISDYGNHRVRMVDLSGIITTIAGSSTFGYSGDGGPATAAELKCPFGLSFDASGSLYFSDQVNNRVRKVTSGIISLVAGSGVSGYAGDGGPATAADLHLPLGIAFGGGNMYFIDSSFRVRKLSGCEPYVSAIGGSDTVCTGSSVVLTDSVAGGYWSTVNGDASVSAGIVTGITPGIDTISYTLSSTCGTSGVTKVIHIISCPVLGNEQVLSHAVDITISPNPVQDRVLIKTVSGMSSHVIMTNTTGLTLLENTYNSPDILLSLSQYPPGIYLIYVNDRCVFKVVKL